MTKEMQVSEAEAWIRRESGPTCSKYL
jgi:hypothetical protein